jgi:hypothetical protein
MRLGYQRQAPAALRPGKTRHTLFRRLGGPRGRSGRMRKISHPNGIRSPDRPARSESLYRTSYPGPHKQTPSSDVAPPLTSRKFARPRIVHVVLSPGHCANIMTVITYTVACFVPFLCLVRHYSFRFFYFVLCSDFSFVPFYCMAETIYNMVLVIIGLLFLIFIVTNKCTISTIIIYITTVSLCNLHCYMFRHCHVTITQFTINALICVWPCIIKVGKVNMELQLDATLTVLLISKISSTCFGQTFAHLQ